MSRYYEDDQSSYLYLRGDTLHDDVTSYDVTDQEDIMATSEETDALDGSEAYYAPSYAYPEATAYDTYHAPRPRVDPYLGSDTFGFGSFSGHGYGHHHKHHKCCKKENNFLMYLIGGVLALTLFNDFFERLLNRDLNGNDIIGEKRRRKRRSLSGEEMPRLDGLINGKVEDNNE